MSIGKINTQIGNTALHQHSKASSGKEFEGLLSSYNQNTSTADKYIFSPKTQKATPSEMYSRTNSAAAERLLFPLEEEDTEDTEDTVKNEKQESETNSDIMVQPDGSRVLVLTIKSGSFESTMSVELSKPTELPQSEGSIAEEKMISTNESLGEVEAGNVN